LCLRGLDAIACGRFPDHVPSSHPSALEALDVSENGTLRGEGDGHSVAAAAPAGPIQLERRRSAGSFCLTRGPPMAHQLRAADVFSSVPVERSAARLPDSAFTPCGFSSGGVDPWQARPLLRSESSLSIEHTPEECTGYQWWHQGCDRRSVLLAAAIARFAPLHWRRQA
jgi:hypothetical protein